MSSILDKSTIYYKYPQLNSYASILIKVVHTIIFSSLREGIGMMSGSGCFSMMIQVPDLVLKPKNTRVSVIDLSQLCHHNTSVRSLVVKDIGRACQEQGYFQVVNHGIHTSVTSSALEVASNFFEVEPSDRAEIESEDVRKPVRYCINSMNGVGKVREMLKHYAHPQNEWLQMWPANPPDYREKMGKYAIEVRRVGLQIMGGIFESLRLGKDYNKDKVEEGMQMLAVNKYPVHHRSGITLGLATHTDYGYITIILQDCEGLQVLDPTQGWIVIPECPGTLHVHVGDNLEVLSNGMCKSLKHRVMLNSQKPRTSIASIHGLGMDEKVVTATELVDEQHPNRYRESSFRGLLDYLSSTHYKGESFLDTLRLRVSNP